MRRFPAGRAGIAGFGLALAATALFAGPMPGAIFTTTSNGSRVNANLYESKDDVYLDGGPGPNAPAGAAALTPGDYYFQVTDPSGKTLLSTDAVACRRFRVNAAGVIDFVYPATEQRRVRGETVTVDCTHRTGVDQDHASLGAITVQLMPYADTPNRGGVYKAWVTPVERFVGDPAKVDNPEYFHGFVPAWSKTDNFKVRRKSATPPGTLTVRKFRDCDGNGRWDAGEVEVTGWRVEVTDPLGVTNVHYTPFTIDTAPAGTWTVTESTEATTPTASYLDGVQTSATPTASPTVVVEVTGAVDEAHSVTFGNHFS